jgi:hypothetical protein
MLAAPPVKFNSDYAFRLYVETWSPGGGFTFFWKAVVEARGRWTLWR